MQQFLDRKWKAPISKHCIVLRIGSIFFSVGSVTFTIVSEDRRTTMSSIQKLFELPNFLHITFRLCEVAARIFVCAYLWYMVISKYSPVSFHIIECYTTVAHALIAAYAIAQILTVAIIHYIKSKSTNFFHSLQVACVVSLVLQIIIMFWFSTFSNNL